MNPHYCLSYLISKEGSKEVVLIDPVLEHVNDYLKLLKNNDYKLKYIIDTHSHADHISGAAALKDHTDCDYIMHKNAPSQCVTISVDNEDELELLDTKVKVLFTPGHTDDSISLIFPDRIFTGDVLFLDDGGAGRADLPGGSPSELYDTLQKILKLPDQLVVFPSHDYRKRKPSNIMSQKKNNPFLIKRTKDEFVSFLEDLKLGPADWMNDVLKANYACARDPSAAWIPVDTPACEVKGTLEINVNEQIVTPISPKELKNRFDNNSTPLLIDVREKHELIGPFGHLSDIKHIPLLKLISNLENLSEYKNQEIIIVCRSGSRAFTASQIMQQTGFTNVRVLDGGMIAWRIIEPL